MDKVKIQILMSTYNGEEYLEEQLNSILNQTEQSFKLIIRDDGSKDNTIKILKEYYQKYPNKIELILDNNIGARDSFLFLLKKVDLKSEFYALADQDDVWKENKLERALECINKKKNQKFEKNGILYCSSYDFVDENLKFIRKGPIKTEKYLLDTRNSIYQAMVWGCTSVFTKEVLLKIREKSYSNENIIMHDVWLYLVASKFSVIIYDEESTLLYRQHGKNLTFNLASFFQKNSKLKMINKKLDGLTLQRKKAQALKFLELYGCELSQEENERIMKFIKSKNIIQRLKNILEKDIVINNVYENAKYISSFIYIFFNA